MSDDDGVAEVIGAIAVGAVALAGLAVYGIVKAIGGGNAEKSVETKPQIDNYEEILREKRRLCQEASDVGEDVCWICLTVEPDRCICDNCLVCDRGGNSTRCCNCATDD